MNSTRTEWFRAPRLVGASLAILLGMALAGCGDDPASPNPNPTPASTTYTGSTTSGSAGGNGTLAVTVATGTPAPNGPGAHGGATITATGVFTPAGGAAVTLTGTYDDVQKEYTITGGGWSFTGGLTSFGSEGFFSGPGGVNGTFSLFVGTSAVTVIVGRYNSTTNPHGVDGNFNFSINGNEVHGNAFVDGSGTPIPLDGTYNSPTAGHIIIYVPGTSTAPYLAEGNYVGTTASGTWNNQSGDSGTWTGTKQ